MYCIKYKGSQLNSIGRYGNSPENIPLTGNCVQDLLTHLSTADMREKFYLIFKKNRKYNKRLNRYSVKHLPVPFLVATALFLLFILILFPSPSPSSMLSGDCTVPVEEFYILFIISVTITQTIDWCRLLSSPEEELYISFILLYISLMFGGNRSVPRREFYTPCIMSMSISLCL